MESDSLNVSVGSRLWHEGAVWTVAELEGTIVVLQARNQFKRVHAPSLVGRAQALDDPPQDEDPHAELDAVILAGLNAEQRRHVEREAEVYEHTVLTQSALGLEARYEKAATILDISPRSARRRAIRYAERGLAGLVDARLIQPARQSVTKEWDQTCIEVLASFTDLSNPTRQAVLRKTNAIYLDRHPGARVPSRSVAYKRLRELDRGRYTFGTAKHRRSVAARPQGAMGRLRADRPGQYVVLDTTKLDVFAREPITGNWLNTELTVAMDLYSRCVLGLVLRPVSTTAQDVSSVLYQVVTPQHWGPPVDAKPQPYLDVPEVLQTQSTGALPDTIVVDHGKVYLSARTKAVCHRLGINIQPAIPYKPTDKPTIERFFRTLRQKLLENLPAYKGPDVSSRGKNVEDKAFYYVSELETIIRDWVGIYHQMAHRGLCDPLLPEVKLSPMEMFTRGMTAAGVMRLPSRQDLRMEFLDVAWRTIQHYGVEIDHRRYDGSALNPYRGTKSAHTGAHPGLWPIMVDRDDVRSVFFQDPDSQTWHTLEWEHAQGLNAPFSAAAAAYTRQESLLKNRHIDEDAAIADLLRRNSKGATVERRKRDLARLLATQPTDGTASDQDPSNQPHRAGVIDMFAHLDRRREQSAVEDDLDDVFSKYLAANPEGTTEVLD